MNTPFKYSNPSVCQLHLCWRCTDKKQSMENWADLWVTVCKVYWVCQKNRTNQSSFCLMATQVVLLQKTIIIWDGRNHLAVTLLIRKRQPRYTTKKRISSPSKWTNWGTFFVGWCNGDTHWDWIEACWRVFNCSCRTNCNTRHCHWKNMQTPDEYYVPMWCLILNKDQGWCCLTQAFS